MPLNTRASFTLSTPSMAGRIASLLQSSLQMAVTVVCYFPMISWWLAYITVNICWKNIHAHNMLFLRLTKSRALFYLTPTWYDVVGHPVSLPFLIPEPSKEKLGSCSKTLQWLWLYSAKQHVQYVRTIINLSPSSDRARNHLQLPCRFSLKGSGIRKGRDTRRPTTTYQVGVK